MTQTPTLLAVLLDRRGLDRCGTFRPAYEQAARAVGPRLARSAPRRAQFHRWTSGELRGLPCTDHCRVLERMLNGYSAAQFFQPRPDRALPASERAANGDSPAPSVPAPESMQALAGVEAVFASRSEFAAPGFLSSLTRLSIDLLSWLGDRLPGPVRDRLGIAVYDETIRFNILISQGRACVVQPYLPQARGVDSPTLLIRPGGEPGSLYPVFEHVWDALAKRSTPL